MPTLLLLACVLAQPGTGTVFGTVTNDLDSTTIAGAILTLWEHPAFDSTVADSHGCFSMELTPGIHTLRASYRDYVPAARSFALESGTRVRVDFQIHPKPVEMPPVQVEVTKRVRWQRLPGSDMIVPAPPPRLSTSAAVQLMLEMDAQRQRESLLRQLDWMVHMSQIVGVDREN
jgi:hypothetical protein